MKLQLVLLENNPIIVSDDLDGAKYVYEKQPKGRFVRGITNEPFKNIDFFKTENEIHDTKHQNIITSLPDLPSIDWNGLESEFGYVDVVQLAIKIYGTNPYDSSEKDGFIRGYHKCKELYNNMFSLEDMRKSFANSFEHRGYDYRPTMGDLEIELNKLRSQPKTFDIEVEMEYKDGYGYWYDYTPMIAESIKIPFGLRPKITNGKLKILKKL